MREQTDLAVPMRDGTVLRADVYLPDDPEPVPALLSRTPYDRTRRVTAAAAIDPERATAAGFALVCQDVRGRYASEGDFYPFATEGPDGFDSVEWVAAQPWCSGAVAMAGRSYAAATQWLAAAQRPEALRAIVPVVTGSDTYDGWVYQGGAFQLGFNLFWVHMMSGGRANEPLDEQVRRLPLGTAPVIDRSSAGGFYRDWLAHPTRDGYWLELAGERRHSDVEVPALNVGGWYDVFLGGTLANFRRMRSYAATPAARERTRLVIGPWAHGSAYGPYPDHSFQAFDNQDIDLDGLALDFLAEQCGAVAAGGGGSAPVRIFVMGDDVWREEDDWPLARARETPWYLRAGGGLSPEPPGDEPPDEYVYDPDDPAPTIGGPTSLPGRFLRKGNAGPLDQRPVEERPDVLVYSSEPLGEPLEVTGELTFVLHAASDAPDTDWIVKLCDVDADGFSRLLVEGVLRARYRNGFGEPERLEPGSVQEYAIDLSATSNAFARGHRIRIDLTSSSFPRFDRNPNVLVPPAEVVETDLRPARQTVFHDSGRASHVILPVIASGAL